MVKFFMCIGISGSGKSSYLKKFPKKSIICPDDIRKEITGDISDQSQNGLVWGTAKERIVKKLSNGEDVILDATNVNSKLRGKFLKDIPDDVEKIAIVFPLPDVDEAFRRIQKDIKNNVDRSNVPLEVLLMQKESYKNGLNNIKNQFDRTIFID